MVRNDLDPETSRSARPLLVHRAIDGSPGLPKVAEFGEEVGPGTVDGFISDSGLRPLFPAVEIYRVQPDGTPMPGSPAAPTSPRPPRWCGWPADRSRCCASTNGAGCWTARHWDRCC